MSADPKLIQELYAQCKAELEWVKTQEGKLFYWSPEKWGTQAKVLAETRMKVLLIMERLAQGDVEGAKTAWERINE